MDDNKILELTSKIESTLGAENFATISDTIGEILTGNTLNMQALADRDKEIDTLKDKFVSIQSLGYSSSDVVKMIQGCPFLFGYHIKSIEEKIEFYKECGLGSLIVDESKFLFYNLRACGLNKWLILRKKLI